MALKYGFFDSLNGDRKYSASDFGDLFTGLISEGVYQGVLDEFDVDTIWGGGLATHYVIGTGRAWLDGKWISNDSPVQFEINHSIDNDTDEYIFIVVDNRLAYRQIRFEVLRTLPTNTPSLKYYMIAQTKINLTGSVNITKKVGTSTLPYVSGLISTYSIDQHADNWEAAWNTYIQAKITETDDIVSGIEEQLRMSWDVWFNDFKNTSEQEIAYWTSHETNRQNTQDTNILVLQKQVANYLERIKSLEDTGVTNASTYIEPWINEFKAFRELTIGNVNDMNIQITDAVNTVNNMESIVTDIDSSMSLINEQLPVIHGDIDALQASSESMGVNVNKTLLRTKNLPDDGSFDITADYRKIVDWNKSLNTFTSSGKYYSANGHQGITNTPNDTSKARFTLDVINVSGWITQKFKFLDGYPNEYIRNFDGVSWSTWENITPLQRRGALPAGDVNSVAYWVKVPQGIYQATDSQTNSKGMWGVVTVTRLHDAGWQVPTTITWETDFGGHAKWTGYYSDSSTSMIWVKQHNIQNNFIQLYGTLPPIGWAEASVSPIPSSFGYYPMVLSSYYKNANGVWVPASDAHFVVMTGGDGTYVNIQTSNTAVAGLPFEVVIMSRNAIAFHHVPQKK